MCECKLLCVCLIAAVCFLHPYSLLPMEWQILQASVDVLSTIKLIVHSLPKRSNHNLSLDTFHLHSCRSTSQGHFQLLQGFNWSQRGSQGGGHFYSWLVGSNCCFLTSTALPLLFGARHDLGRVAGGWSPDTLCNFGGDNMLQACSLVTFLCWIFMSCYYHNHGSCCRNTTSLCYQKYFSLHLILYALCINTLCINVHFSGTSADVSALVSISIGQLSTWICC